jgi:hypothetical protein
MCSMKKRNLIVPAVALSAVLGGAVIGTQIASADEEARTSFAAKIAAYFNLDEDEVRSFLEDERQERQEEMHVRFEERLNEAVENGELTEEQKSLILAKREELEVTREENRPEHDGEAPTEEEREAHRAEMEEERAALEAWAEENGIDMRYLMGAGRGGFGGPGPGR